VAHTVAASCIATRARACATHRGCVHCIAFDQRVPHRAVAQLGSPPSDIGYNNLLHTNFFHSPRRT
jgi:hypothetical protein